MNAQLEQILASAGALALPLAQNIEQNEAAKLSGHIPTAQNAVAHGVILSAVALFLDFINHIGADYLRSKPAAPSVPDTHVM